MDQSEQGHQCSILFLFALNLIVMFFCCEALCTVLLDRMASETRSKQKINEEREKDVAAALGGLKNLKLYYGDAKKRL